jgi:ABC-type sugar transport system ATPase subunit
MLVSHDPDDTLPWGEEFIVLQQGKLIQRGSALQIYSQPTNEYVAGLFGKYSLIPKKLFGSSGIEAVSTLIVRPEHFTLSIKKTLKSKRAKIIKIEYYGSTRLLIVQIQGVQIQALDTFKHRIFEGSIIYIALKKQRAILN